MTWQQLDTPALLVDLDRIEGNIRRVADYAAQKDLNLRPHTKTHKTPEIGRMQLSAGAVGLTVAKVSEAEVMLASGVEDLLVAYPLVGRPKLERLADIAQKTRVTVAIDSWAAAEGLAEATKLAGRSIGALIEIDAGVRRTGVDPGGAAVELARRVDGLAGVELRGFNFYPGHIWLPDGDEPLHELSATVAALRAEFERAGLNCEIVSGGSTPTLFRSHEVQGLTEIRPGTSIFFDRMQVEAGVCTFEDCAATVLTTVVSTPTPDRIILDGGSKTFSSDPVRHTEDPTWGRIVEAPEARFYKMNEEHGYVDVSGVERRFEIGDKVRVIPNHVCVCVNLHERMHVVRGDEVFHVWPVGGRGKLQ